MSDETALQPDAPAEPQNDNEKHDDETHEGETHGGDVIEAESAAEVLPDSLRLIEALLFASAEPVSQDALARHLPEDADLPALLDRLQSDYEGRGINLARVGQRWAFRSAADLGPRLQIETESVRKLSRAAVETLAIIAYHQPVTRAEIEEIRGVALSRGTLDTLLEAGWVRPRGRRRTPGRPVTWGTNEAFLDQFGLENLDDLPGIGELKAAGLLDTRPAIAALGASGKLAQLAAESEEGGTDADAEDGEDALEEGEGAVVTDLNADGPDGESEDEAAETAEEGTETPLEADFGEDLLPEEAEEPSEAFEGEFPGEPVRDAS